MPKSRMIATDIGRNYRVAQLPYEPHDAQKFYTWMVLIGDREGRLPGDPKLLTKIVAPHCDYPPEEVEEWLRLMESLKDDETGFGLIETYEVNGHKYIWFPGWENWQPRSYRSRESPSKIPSPPVHNFSGRSKKPRKSKRAQIDDIIDEALKKKVDCYEANIAVMTPVALEQIKSETSGDPPGWFEKAVDEAVTYNKRNLKYILAILRRWRDEGIASLDHKPTGDGSAGMVIEE